MWPRGASKPVGFAERLPAAWIALSRPGASEWRIDEESDDRGFPVSSTSISGRISGSADLSLIERANGRHPCRSQRHNLGHKSGQGTGETDNSYECSDPRSRMCVPAYFTTSMNFRATFAVNLPDLELAVEPHWSPAHLVATRPASLLSMHRLPWRSGT